MASSEIIASLVEDAAKLMGLAPAVPDPQRIAWSIAFDAETAFDVELDAPRNRLVLSGAIRNVADTDRLAVCEMLLQFNYLWPDTGGVRMALDGTPGQAVMLFDVAADGLQPFALASLLDGLADMQRAWREILEAFAGRPGDGLPAAVLDAAARLAPSRRFLNAS